MESVRRVTTILLMIMLIFVFACLTSIWISYNRLTVSQFTVTSDKIISPFRIVLISDLHDHRFDSCNAKLSEMIKKQTPDIIIIDGDMINGDSENAETAVALIHRLIDIAPVYYSYGNHEYYYIEAGHDDLREELEGAGAVVVNYRRIDIEVAGNQIRIGGLYEYGGDTYMQPDEENQRAVSYLQKYADTDRYLIMCAHRPESFYPLESTEQWKIDLILSGHLHGGQVILPGIGGIYNTLDGFFPKYDYGQYSLWGSDMIITRGLSTNLKLLPRFNNPPEIAVVDVVPD